MEKSKCEKAYSRGKEDSKNAGILDSLCHDLGKIFTFTKEDQSYDAGWDDDMKGKK